MKITKTAYILPNLRGKPCQGLGELARELANQACFDDLSQIIGLTTHPAKDRRKVRITLTVEAA